MKLIILDRDGVINQDSDAFVKTPDEWIALPGSLQAIARLTQAGWKVVLATNQSGLARGYYDANRACGSLLYTDHMIYSPAVPFFRDDQHRLLEEPFCVSVITAPAPTTSHAAAPIHPHSTTVCSGSQCPKIGSLSIPASSSRLK